VLLAAGTDSDHPLHSALGERLRFGLLDETRELSPIPVAQVPRPSAAAADQLHDPPPLVRLELREVLTRQQEQLAEDYQPRRRKRSKSSSDSCHYSQDSLTNRWPI
jgi:hypothetical protein